MTIKKNRRDFVKQALQTGVVAATAGPWILSSKALAAKAPEVNGRKLRHASVGTGRRGMQDLDFFTTHPDFELTALCDVDKDFLDVASKRFPKARLYRDWRVMFEKEGDQIDSVNATVPNHMHAPIAMTALDLGKHIYCQKPLTHSIYESRRLAEAAALKPEIVTQMGVQSHSAGTYLTAEALIKAGVIGKIKEAHSWDIVRFYYTGAYADPPVERRPDHVDEIPDTLDWDLWLGVAPERPFVKDLYHTRWWRRWSDFGGGAHGDMGGHMMDGVFTALDLTAPKWLLSYRTPPYEETFSPNNKILYRFPGTEYTTGDIDYYWHDTGPVDAKSSWPVDQDKKLPGSASMFVGEKGHMLLEHGKMPQVIPDEKFRKEVEAIEKEVGVVEGEMADHYHQFIDACLGKGTASAPFSYSGNLTESILMGTVVNRFPKEKLIWNAEALEFTNKPEANKYLQRSYREGWHVQGLG